MALVTGGIRGIGAAISEELASRGATIAAGFSGNVSAPSSSPTDFADRFSASVSTHRGNVASPDDCRRVVNEVIEQHGRLDILINNAGITIDKTILKLSDDDWHKVLDVNLSGAFFLSQAALAATWWSAAAAASSTVSSIIGEIGNIGRGQLRGVQVRALRADQDVRAGSAPSSSNAPASSTMTASGITVNTVTPGYTWTEMVAAVPEKVLDKLRLRFRCVASGRPRRSPHCRTSSPADESSYITGQVWGVNGGMDMWPRL